MLKGDSPVIRSDGTFVRDYFFVRDAVQAYLALAERVPEDGFIGEAFNFGTETPLSVTQMAGEILRIMGREDLQLTILNQASNEISRQYLDCAKARARMQWAPSWTLDDALRETVAWYRDYFQRRET